MAIKNIFKPKTIVIWGSIVLAMLAGALIFTGATASSRLCASCHILTPEYFTWQASSHRQIACVECHVEPGVSGFANNKLKLFQHTFLYLRGDYKIPLKIKKRIPDSACIGCHSFYRELTPKGDLIVPHKTHYEKKIDCMTCHPGVAHGHLVSRGLNTREYIDKFTPAMGKKIIKDKVLTGVSMNACMKCHDGRGGPMNCDACHSTSKYPEFHRNKTFSTLHGDWGRKDLASCDLCHGYYATTGKGKPAPDKGREKADAAALYSRVNTFCADCHGKLPRSHQQKNWNVSHGEGKITARCIACHDNRFCYDCHVIKPAAHETPNFNATHGKSVKKTAYCNYCHGSVKGAPDVTETKCTECHVPGRHNDFDHIDHNIHRKTPPDKLPECDNCHMDCITCHSGQKCTPCHTGNIRMERN